MKIFFKEKKSSIFFRFFVANCCFFPQSIFFLFFCRHSDWRFIVKVPATMKEFFLLFMNTTWILWLTRASRCYSLTHWFIPNDSRLSRDGQKMQIEAIRQILGRKFRFSFFCCFIQVKPTKPIMAAKPLMSPITRRELPPFNSFLRHIAGIRRGFATRPPTAPGFRWPPPPNLLGGSRDRTCVSEIKREKASWTSGPVDHWGSGATLIGFSLWASK